jgi:arabinofuranosyltransferase
LEAINKILEQYKTSILMVLGCLFLVFLYRTAWLCDDAYISYRTIDNFVNGYGLTYNPGQRVQAFTHPLWVIIHIPFYYLSSNAYVIGLLVSMLVSISAVAFLVIKVVRKPIHQMFVLLLLFSSKAFMDFSTSGLENPLSHLLLALFVFIYLYKTADKRYLIWLSLVSGLAMLNRMDSILLFAPALAFVWWPQRSWKSFLWVLLGLSPFLLWEVFALIYYGFPFPMSAYSKLNVGLSRGDLLVQGWYYFWNVFGKDPITLFTIVAGLTTPFYLKQKKHQPLVVGMALYLLYIFWIGGDFMQGRFFCAPFFLAVIILSTIEFDLKVWVLPLPVLMGFLSLGSPMLSGADYGVGFMVKMPMDHGITDERAYYFQSTGLIAIEGWEPESELVDRGKGLKKSGAKFYITGNMGLIGYYAGPKLHLIDRYALTDPFLAQLPNSYQPNWRPGHNQRLIPPGYIKSLTSESNKLRDKKLQQLYNATNLLSKGSIWSSKRLKTIFQFNFTGKYKGLIDKQHYFIPFKTTRTLSEMNLPVTDVSQWNSPGHVISSSDGGLKIIGLPKTGLNQLQLQLWLHSRCEFVVVFRKGETILDGNIILATSPTDGLSHYEIPTIPKHTNNIVIYPNTHQSECGIGNVRLVPK